MHRVRCWVERLTVVALAWLAVLTCGCFSLRSEHEVKPIHITMDVTLRMDRELDRYLGPIEEEVAP